MTLRRSLTLVTPPAAEPVTLAETKAHLRVDIEDDDALIARLVAAARRRVEGETGHALITQTWDLVLDRFPDGPRIELPRPPLQSVTSITYTDAAGVTATLSLSAYLADTDAVPGAVVLAAGASWPAFTPRPVGAVRVRFICGFGPTPLAVPEDLRQAVLLLVGHWYETREAVIAPTGAPPAEVALAYSSLILDYRHRARRW